MSKYTDEINFLSWRAYIKLERKRTLKQIQELEIREEIQEKVWREKRKSLTL